MKFNNTLTEIIMTDLEVGLVPALIGEAGIGKSSFVEALAKNMDTKAFTLPCNQLADKADLTGARLVPYTQSNGTQSYTQVFYPNDVVQQAIDYARDNPREWPILFFDEVNRTSSDVTSAILTMITLRQLGRETLPKNLRIMVAGNDKGNVVSLDEASISRFAIYSVEPDAHTLMAILGDSLHPYVIAVLTKYPQLVFEKSQPKGMLADGMDDDDPQVTSADLSSLAGETDEMLQLTTPRTIEGVSSWLNHVQPDKLQEYLQSSIVVDGEDTTVLNQVIVAHVGNTTFATQLIAEIANGISAGTASTNVSLSAPKPNCYNDLKTAGSVTELENKIAGLTERERSGSLLYALYERADNQPIIEQLAQQLPALEGPHVKLLIDLQAASALDTKNVTVLTKSPTPVGITIGQILDAIGGN